MNVFALLLAAVEQGAGVGWGPIAAMIVTAVTSSTGLTWVCTARASGRKLDREAERVGIDAAVVVSNAALGLIAPFEAQVGRLTTRIADLEREVDSLTDRLTLAHRLLDANGIPFPRVRGD